MSTTQFSYLIDNLNVSSDDAVVHSFNTLTVSPYKDGQYRLRRYSCFSFNRENHDIVLTTNDGFVQSGQFNEFQGGMLRSYDDLTEATFQSPLFIDMVSKFAEIARLPQLVKIEVHQMRIIAKESADAVATPEGIHQDGFDFIGVFTINRHNVKGGDLLLWQNKHDDEPLTVLSPMVGDFCVLNDKLLWHSATNVVPLEQGTAYWDLFVMTANQQDKLV